MKKTGRDVRKPVQKRSIRKRERLVSAALALIRRKGFTAVSVREIVSKAGVSIGTYYAYFKDKNDILSEILAILSRDFFDAFATEVREEMVNTKKLKDLVYFMITSLEKKYEANQSLYRELETLILTDKSFNRLYNSFRYEKVKPLFHEIMDHFRHQIVLQHSESAMVVMFKSIEEITKHLVFSEPQADDELIKRETAAMICNYVLRNHPRERSS